MLIDLLWPGTTAEIFEEVQDEGCGYQVADMVGKDDILLSRITSIVRRSHQAEDEESSLSHEDRGEEEQVDGHEAVFTPFPYAFVCNKDFLDTTDTV